MKRSTIIELIILSMKPLSFNDFQIILLQGLIRAWAKFLMVYNPRLTVMTSTTKVAL